MLKTNLAVVDDSREIAAGRIWEMSVGEKGDDRVRPDRWLQAVHFFKTRTLVKAMIEGGKAHCRDERCKPSKEPGVGEESTIRTGFSERTVTIRVLSVVRHGTPEAQALYEETADSVENHEHAAAMCKAGALDVQTERRSGGKQRRRIYQLRGGQD